MADRNQKRSAWLFLLGAVIAYSTEFSPAMEHRMGQGLGWRAERVGSAPCLNCQISGQSRNPMAAAATVTTGSSTPFMMLDTMNAVMSQSQFQSQYHTGPGRFRHLSDQSALQFPSPSKNESTPKDIVAENTQKILGDLSWWTNSASTPVNPNFVMADGWQSDFRALLNY